MIQSEKSRFFAAGGTPWRQNPYIYLFYISIFTPWRQKQCDLNFFGVVGVHVPASIFAISMIKSIAHIQK